MRPLKGKIMEGLGQLCYIVFILTESLGICIACDYRIKDIPPDTLRLTNNLDIGQSIFTFILFDQNGSSVINKQIEFDPTKLLGRGSYVISDGSNGTAGELVVKKCPTVDAFEQVYLTIPDGDLCESSFSVYVIGEAPVYQIQSEVYVNVDTTEHTVNVLQIKLSVVRHCVNFVCFAGAFNSNKTFTVENGTNWIITATGDIIYGFIYVLGIECEQPQLPNMQSNNALVNVTFVTNTTVNNLQTSPESLISKIRSSVSTTVRVIQATVSSTYWTTQGVVTTPVDNVMLPSASLKQMSLTQQYDKTLLKASTVTFGLKEPQPTEVPFFHTPINVVAVGLTVGLAGLIGTGILAHYLTLRKCRTMTPVSPKVLDSDKEDQMNSNTASRVQQEP